MRLFPTGACLFLCAAVLAPPALAQEDGVIVDPESPAGKEYELPFDSVRRQAAGETGEPDSVTGVARKPAPLFGVGISPEEARRQGGRGDARTGGGSRVDDRADESGRRPESKRRTVGAGASGVDDLPSSNLWSVGIVAAVLLSAAGIAALRRG